MAFWGIEVQPGRPYTHSSKNSKGRLRISQATLAIGTAQLKSSVQCNVGDKRPVLLCALLPNKTESLQLDLEFDEAEVVTFSVIGPCGVYLTGYYVGPNRRSVFPDDSESFGEDIENSVSHESNHGTDDYDYEDSFINDDESEPHTPTPASSNKGSVTVISVVKQAEAELDGGDDQKRDFMKKKIGDDRCKRLIKTYQSDDDLSVPDSIDSDDFKISSIFKKKTQAVGKKVKEETLAKLKDQVDERIIDEQTEGKGDNFNLSMPSLLEVMLEGNKKKQESSKDDKATNALAAKDDQNLDATGEASTSADMGSEKKSKPKKKRKGHSEVSINVTDNNLLAGNKLADGQYATNENQSDEIKVKNKKKKLSKEQETVGTTNMKVEEENNKKTFSSGLVSEDLVPGNSEGKVAAAGRKVKVQYVVQLKENGQVINLKANTAHKFRLGDKEVIEGLNVGLEGMRVGDRRRLTIPPSMSLGYEVDGENVPPHSWLVYDVEMISIH